MNLIIDLNKLYSIYDHNDITIYFHYSFLDHMEPYFDQEILYDIINTLDERTLIKLYDFIRIKLLKLQRILSNDSTLSIDERYNYINNLSLEKIKPTQSQFNDIIAQLLNKDPFVSIFLTNIILRFLYPC